MQISAAAAATTTTMVRKPRNGYREWTQGRAARRVLDAQAVLTRVAETR